MPPSPTSSGDDKMSQDEKIRLRNEARRRNGDTTETCPVICSIAPLKPYQEVRDNSTYKGYLPITMLNPKGYYGSLVERPTASERRNSEAVVESPEEAKDQNSSAEQLHESRMLVPMSMLASSNSPSSSHELKSSQDAGNERQETQTAYRLSTQRDESVSHFLGSNNNKRKREDSDLRGSESSSNNRSSRQPRTFISLDELLCTRVPVPIPDNQHNEQDEERGNHRTSNQAVSSNGMGLRSAAGRGLSFPMQQHVDGHTEQRTPSSLIPVSLSTATKARNPTISLPEFPISAMPMLSSFHGYEDQADKRSTPGRQGESREARKDSGSTPSSCADPVTAGANEPISSHRIFNDLQLHYADYNEYAPSSPESVEDEESGARMLTGAKLMDDVGGSARARRFLC